VSEVGLIIGLPRNFSFCLSNSSWVMAPISFSLCHSFNCSASEDVEAGFAVCIFFIGFLGKQKTINTPTTGMSPNKKPAVGPYEISDKYTSNYNASIIRFFYKINAFVYVIYFCY